MHFVISTLARGGFSGGPVISEYDFLLGVATEALLVIESIIETGFTAVLSVEQIWDLLLENHVLPPGVNGEFMVEYFDSSMDDWTEDERVVRPDEPYPLVLPQRDEDGHVVSYLHLPTNQ